MKESAIPNRTEWILLSRNGIKENTGHQVTGQVTLGKVQRKVLYYFISESQGHARRNPCPTTDHLPACFSGRY